MKNVDLRVKKTKTALSVALMELLNKRSFDEIKVVDICETAQVHRTTFYKHFEDKYHLLSYVAENIINELAENIAPITDYDMPYKYNADLLKNVISYIHNNREKFRLILKNNMHSMFMSTMQNIISEHLLKSLEAFEEKGYKFNADLSIIANYHSGGLISVACFTLDSNKQYDIEEIYEYILSLSAYPRKMEE
jgi:AcrR family transcriptional regulator